MGLFTEKYNTPFDTEEGRQHIKQAPSALHVSAPMYMTTRASLFLGFTLVSFSLIWHFENTFLWWPVLTALIVLTLWAVSMRFFMPRKLAPLTLFILELMFYGLCLLSQRYGLCSGTAPVFFVPMAMGIMMLGRFKADGSEEYTIAGLWEEVYKPFIIAVFAAVFGYFGSLLFERVFVFISLLSSTMFLVVFAYLRNKLTGKRSYLTSKSLTEFWNIPVSDIEELRRFVFTRLQLGLVLAGVVAALLAISIFTGRVASYLMFPVTAGIAVGLGVLMILAGRGGDRKSIFGSRYLLAEVSFSAVCFVLPFMAALPELPEIVTIIKWAVIIILTDIIITGLLAVIRRRLIFVPKIRYVEGLPFYLVLISLVLMLIEVIS